MIFFKELIYMSFVNLFVILFLGNHDTGSQIPPSLEMIISVKNRWGTKGGRPHV